MTTINYHGCVIRKTATGEYEVGIRHSGLTYSMGVFATIELAKQIIDQEVNPPKDKQ